MEHILFLRGEANDELFRKTASSILGEGEEQAKIPIKLRRGKEICWECGPNSTQQSTNGAYCREHKKLVPAPARDLVDMTRPINLNRQEAPNPHGEEEIRTEESSIAKSKKWIRKKLKRLNDMDRKADREAYESMVKKISERIYRDQSRRKLYQELYVPPQKRSTFKGKGPGKPKNSNYHRRPKETDYPWSIMEEDDTPAADNPAHEPKNLTSNLERTEINKERVDPSYGDIEPPIRVQRPPTQHPSALHPSAAEPTTANGYPVVPKIETDQRALCIKLTTRPTTPAPQAATPEYIPTHFADENLGAEIPKNSDP